MSIVFTPHYSLPVPAERDANKQRSLSQTNLKGDTLLDTLSKRALALANGELAKEATGLFQMENGQGGFLKEGAGTLPVPVFSVVLMEAGAGKILLENGDALALAG